MEEAFYSGQKKQETDEEPLAEEIVVKDIAAEAEAESGAANETDTALLMRLLQKPEMAQILKTLAANL